MIFNLKSNLCQLVFNVWWGHTWCFNVWFRGLVMPLPSRQINKFNHLFTDCILAIFPKKTIASKKASDASHSQVFRFAFLLMGLMDCWR